MREAIENERKFIQRRLTRMHSGGEQHDAFYDDALSQSSVETKSRAQTEPPPTLP